MGPVRIRWRSAGRIGAIAVAVLLIVRLIPGLLQPPDPPPLAPDVGLPRFPGKQVEVRLEPIRKDHGHKRRLGGKEVRNRHSHRRRKTKKKHVKERKSSRRRRPQRPDDGAAADPSPPALPTAPPPPVAPAPVVADPPQRPPPAPTPEASREFGLP